MCAINPVCLGEAEEAGLGFGVQNQRPGGGKSRADQGTARTAHGPTALKLSQMAGERPARCEDAKSGGGQQQQGGAKCGHASHASCVFVAFAFAGSSAKSPHGGVREAQGRRNEENIKPLSAQPVVSRARVLHCRQRQRMPACRTFRFEEIFLRKMEMQAVLQERDRVSSDRREVDRLTNEARCQGHRASCAPSPAVQVRKLERQRTELVRPLRTYAKGPHFVEGRLVWFESAHGYGFSQHIR